MDNEQAKLILSAYRTRGEEASDPVFAEALEQVRHDPELGHWFADQRQFDESMCRALESLQPPAGLRDQLLVQQRIVQLQQPQGRVARWRSQPAWWFALAATILLLAGLGWHLSAPSNEPLPPEQFLAELFQLKQSGKISLGKMGGGTRELQAWLAQRGSPSDFTLPPPLEALGGIGCQTFTIHGQKTSLICFMLDRSRVVHFFVTNNRGLTPSEGTGPSVVRKDNLTAITWTAGGHTFVLMGKDVDEATLRRLI
ncbi:MAG: hypothetical protein SNJ84_06015 [Verrucomicrobiia bacterium]